MILADLEIIAVRHNRDQIAIDPEMNTRRIGEVAKTTDVVAMAVRIEIDTTAIKTTGGERDTLPIEIAKRVEKRRMKR